MNGSHAEIVNLLTTLEKAENLEEPMREQELVDGQINYVGDKNDKNVRDLFALIKTVQKKLENVKNRLETCGGGGGTPGNSNGGSAVNKKTPDHPRFTRRTTDKYCWTHGGCAHESKDCTRKAPGHKDSATFANKQGGSIGFCTD